MTIRRMIMTVAVFLAFIAAPSATTAAEPDLPACQTNPWRSVVVHEFTEGSWGYLYRVIWCVEGAQVRWAVADVVPVLPDDSDCTWMDSKVNSLKPMPNSASWLGFNMGWFSCPGDDGSVDDYPWGIIQVRPDGSSAIQDQGTA